MSLSFSLDTLTVFRSLEEDPVIAALGDALHKAAALASDAEEGNSTSGDAMALARAYATFVAALFDSEAEGLGSYILDATVDDENVYLRTIGAGRVPGASLAAAAEAELSVLQELADLEPQDFLELMPGAADRLPAFDTQKVDIAGTYHERIANISKYGYGMYARYHVFRVDAQGQIVPVKHPDPQRLEDLVDYEREKKVILDNTRALVKRLPAANILLTGDAGTGKSSTIKAVAAHYAPEGLRLVEVKKTQLYQIPAIMEELSANPLKFILFIDDLSFSGNDDNFSALKATLEGSISGTGDNVTIYATSNRRHLVKETFQDREGDELHLSDTIQETMSLAARFGLTITFQKPGKDEYLEIVRSLAAEYGIDMDEEELFRKAEAHALRKNGRSPRTAKQFIELLKIGI